MDFDWGKVKGNWRRWWAGELERPVFNITVSEPEPGVKAFWSHYDFSIPAIDILKSRGKALACDRHHADAFPSLWPNFGPGVLAAFTGGEGRNAEDTVWFHPGRFEGLDIYDIHVKLDKGAPWFRRVEEFYLAAAKLWPDKGVQLGMTDLGGALDVLASFRPGEQLLLDLYDHPEEVKRITWEIHAAWWETFEHFDALNRKASPGHSAWTPLYSDTRYYMTQCDFSYMISPDMFAEFVRPELAATCAKLDHGFYHLDGKGELPHLEHLLSIPELKGVQWIPGAGAPPIDQWPEVVNRIVAAGKKLQVYCGLEQIDAIVSQVDDPGAVAFIGGVGQGQEGELLEVLRKYHAC